MKSKISVLLFLFIGVSFFSYGQTSKKKISTSFYGFVKADYMFDTRQVIAPREGHLLLLPAPKKMINDKDVNARANFNILAIQSRVGMKISGPDFFGMKTSGLLEADFFGNSKKGGLDDVNGFRLRHAFIKLSNEKVDILMGQFWHPMFVTDVFPGTYSFNTGIPYQPFSRNPQLRVTTKGNFRFIGVLFTERDFKTRGGSSSKSGIPQVHAQFQFGNKSDVLAGVGANLKTIRPSLETENHSALSFIGYLSTMLGKTTFKAEATYGENMSDLLQIGGVGIKDNGDYINTKTLSLWAELHGDFSENMEWGLFGGYNNNYGFGEKANFKDGLLASSVKNSWRMSPRIGWKSGKMKIGIEGEYTSANYGNLNDKGKIKGESTVGNFRLLTTAIYKF